MHIPTIKLRFYAKQKNWCTEKAFDTAVAQQGYFTASQAHSAGFDDNVHSYHVQKGNWIREWCGIYRLARFPESNDSHLVLWALWSRNRNGEIQGVYSHETALSLYDISDVNPAKLHMTVLIFVERQEHLKFSNFTKGRLKMMIGKKGMATEL